MKSILKRLKYYGIGFGIGLIFVIFFFQNRGCSWLPSNRVKNSLLERLIVVSDETKEVLKKKGLTSKDIVQVLNDGDVDFGKSDKSTDSKMYVLEKDGVDYAFTLPYESFISEVFIGVEISTIKYSTKGYGEILHFPMDDNLVFPDSSRIVSCQQEVLGLVNPRDILKLLKESGKIDFSKSNLKQRPKPEHYLIVKREGEEIGMKVIWYKNKLNITSFEADGLEGCE